MNRLIGVGALVLAIALGACTDGNNGRTEVLGERTQRDVPIIIATSPAETAPPAPVASTPATTPTSTSTKAKSTTAPVAKKGSAVYELQLDCLEDGRRQSGAAVVGPSKGERHDAVAGLKMTYTFTYKKDESSSDPITEWTKKCTVRSHKLQPQAAEPRLSTLLGCKGSVQYSQDPQPASVIDKSWHDLSALTTPFTHTMKAPKNQYQLSEDVTCTISVVSR